MVIGRNREGSRAGLKTNFLIFQAYIFLFFPYMSNRKPKFFVLINGIKIKHSRKEAEENIQLYFFP